jgi:hypothetical protein
MGAYGTIPVDFSMTDTAPTSSLSRVIGWLSESLSWLVLGGGIMTMILTAYLVILSDSPVPYMDQWWFIHRLHEYGSHFPLGYLWEQHNEHRIVVPRLFYLTDLYLFSGNNRFLLAAVYLIQAAQLLLLCWIFGALGTLTGKFWRTAVGIAAFCLFLPTQRETFTWGWQIAFVLPFFCATAGVSAVARDSLGFASRWSWVALSALFALIASFSLANGFLLWPLLCLTMVILRIPLNRIIVTGLLGVTALVFNSIGYQSIAHADPLEALHHPREVATFITHCFTDSWPMADQRVGIYLTWIGIFVTVAGIVWLVLRRPRTPAFAALFSLAAFQVLTVTLIALGRVNLGLAARYQTPALLFWAFFGGICVLALAYRQFQGALLLLQGGVLVVIVLSTSEFGAARREVQTRTQALAIAGDAVAAGVNDTEALHELQNSPELTFLDSKLLHEQHHSLFSSAPERGLGHVTTDFTLAPSGRCEGQINAVNLLPDQRWPGARVTGYAWDREHTQPIEKIMIATDEVITGVGNGDNLVRTNGQGQDLTPQTATWRGFIPPVSRTAALRAYGILEGHTICALGDAQTLSAKTFSLAALYASEGDVKDLVPIWEAGNGVPVIYDGTGIISKNLLIIHSTGVDTQMFFPSPVRLNRFHTLVFKILFEKNDVLELFFGRMIDGRGLKGFVPLTRKWVYVFANVSANRFWNDEADLSFRFDATGAVAVGSTVQLAGVWGREAEMSNQTEAFEFKLSDDIEKHTH